jgi:hypothetical protein
MIAADTAATTPGPSGTTDATEQDTPAPVATQTTPAPTPAAGAKPVEEDAPKPAPQKKIVRKGYLNIDSKPAAEVYVDGTYHGDTPVRLKLRSGKHTIECRNPRYESYRETIKIVKGELSRRNITLKKLMGMVSLNTQAGAELFVDGVLFGITPIMRPIELDAGTHTLAIKKDGFFDWTTQVTVGANDTLPLNIRLSPRY